MDCVVTAPALQGHCYTKEKIQESFVTTGLIDSVTTTCPDVYQMMARCGINFEKNLLHKQNFLNRLDAVMDQQVSHGWVSEDFYDLEQVPEDMDALGNIYSLTATSDVRSRAMVLYTPR